MMNEMIFLIVGSAAWGAFIYYMSRPRLDSSKNRTQEKSENAANERESDSPGETL